MCRSGEQVNFNISSWPRITGGIVMGSCVIPDRLTNHLYHDFLQIIQPGLLLKHRLWFERDSCRGAMGRCTEVAKCSISKNVCWMLRTDCMTSLVCQVKLRINFFPQGHLKEHVHAVPPKTVEVLMARLEATVTVVSCIMLRHILKPSALKWTEVTLNTCYNYQVFVV